MGSRTHRRRYCRCGTLLARDNAGRQCVRCERSSRDKLITPPEVSPGSGRPSVIRFWWLLGVIGVPSRQSSG